MNKSKTKSTDLIAASRRPVSFATSAAKSFSESPPWQALVSSSLLELQYLFHLVQMCAMCSMVSYGVIRLLSTYCFYFFLSYLPHPRRDGLLSTAKRVHRWAGIASIAGNYGNWCEWQRCEWQQYFAVFTNAHRLLTGIQPLDTCQVFGNSRVNH